MHFTKSRIDRLIIALSMLQAFPGCSKPEKDEQVPRDAILFQIDKWTQSGPFSKGFEQSIQSAKAIVKNQGAPRQPYIIGASYIPHKEKGKGELAILCLGEQPHKPEIRGFTLRIARARGNLRDRSEDFAYEFPCPGNFIGCFDHVVIIQLPVWLFDGEEIEAIPVRSTYSTDIVLGDSVGRETLDKALKDAKALDNKAADVLLLFPNALIPTAEIYVKVWDSKGRFSSELRVKKMIMGEDGKVRDKADPPIGD